MNDPIRERLALRGRTRFVSYLDQPNVPNVPNVPEPEPEPDPRAGFRHSIDQGVKGEMPIPRRDFDREMAEAIREFAHRRLVTPVVINAPGLED